MPSKDISREPKRWWIALAIASLIVAFPVAVYVLIHTSTTAVMTSIGDALGTVPRLALGLLLLSFIGVTIATVEAYRQSTPAQAANIRTWLKATLLFIMVLLLFTAGLWSFRDAEVTWTFAFLALVLFTTATIMLRLLLTIARSRRI